MGVTLEPLKEKILANHSDQEVEAYQLKPRDFYLPYLSVVPPLRERRGGQGVRPYYLNEVVIGLNDLPILRRAAERIAALTDTPLGTAARSAIRKLSFDLPELNVGPEERGFTASRDIESQFATLRQAVEQRRAVRCRYYSIRRDVEAERVIEPYGLMLSWGHWYCVARHRSWVTRPPSPLAERGPGGEVGRGAGGEALLLARSRPGIQRPADPPPRR